MRKLIPKKLLGGLTSRFEPNPGLLKGFDAGKIGQLTSTKTNALGATNAFKSPNVATGISAPKPAGNNSPQVQKTGGAGMGAAIGALGSVGQSIGKFKAIADSDMTTAGRNNAMADAGIDTAADAAISSGVPIAMVVGAAVKGVGLASKALVKTPKAFKDFTVDQNVQNSSAFGGVKSSSDAMNKRIGEIKGQSYSRLWSGGWKKDRERLNEVNRQQNMAAGLLQNEKKSNENALSQLDYLSNNVNLQNTGFDMRNVRFGQKGMKFIPKRLNKYDIILTENKNVPFVHRILTGDTRNISTPGVLNSKSTHLIGSYGNLVMPKIYDSGLPFDKLKISGNNMDSVYNSRNRIEFKTESEAEDFAKNYKKSQFWNEFYKTGKFKKGGTIKNSEKENVIVNGKLHKELHDIKDNPEFEDAKLTRKGIPVITKEDCGNIKQHAEVERDELIFNLRVTKQLEGLMELGDEEAMIEAGKLLAYEIVKNTKDSKNKIIKNA